MKCTNTLKSFIFLGMNFCGLIFFQNEQELHLNLAIKNAHIYITVEGFVRLKLYTMLVLFHS